MSEWILVAWVAVASTHGARPHEDIHIKHVVGFDSEERCRASINELLHQESQLNIGSGVYGQCYLKSSLPDARSSATK